MLRIRFGNTGEEITVYEPDFTVAQVDTMRQISELDEFDFCCVPLYESVEKRTKMGPINFLWYDNRNRLHLDRMGVKGTIIKKRLIT